MLQTAAKNYIYLWFISLKIEYIYEKKQHNGRDHFEWKLSLTENKFYRNLKYNIFLVISSSIRMIRGTRCWLHSWLFSIKCIRPPYQHCIQMWHTGAMHIHT